MTDPKASAPRLTIGKVLSALQEEFPDISASKVRFLEAEGLVTPERTASGYRLFSETDLDRLRYVLRAQRDRFWPLKVIAEALDAIDRGLDPGDGGSRPAPPAPAGDPNVPDAAALRSATPVSLTPAELQQSAGLDKESFEALQTYGILVPDVHGRFDSAALEVAGAAARLAAYGIEPRHLRPFRTAADREIGLVEQVLATRGSGSRAERGADILSACIGLHAALVKAGLGSLDD